MRHIKSTQGKTISVSNIALCLINTLTWPARLSYFLFSLCDGKLLRAYFFCVPNSALSIIHSVNLDWPDEETRVEKVEIGKSRSSSSPGKLNDAMFCRASWGTNKSFGELAEWTDYPQFK